MMAEFPEIIIKLKSLELVPVEAGGECYKCKQQIDGIGYRFRVKFLIKNKLGEAKILRNPKLCRSCGILARKLLKEQKIND